MLLAIDTSAGTSVAVVDRDRGVLSEHSTADTRSHAEVIGTLIRQSLDHTGIAVTALSGVAVGMGPGPFTGLRVGIAAARAFAVGARTPIVPIASHDAIAFALGLGADDGVIVATDARRRELFYSIYSGADAAGLPVRTLGPAIAKADELGNPAHHRLIEASEVSAGALGMLAETLYANGRPFADDEPLYLRSPDVTLSAGPKRVTS